MRVLVIPEDPSRDRYILKPVVEHIFADLGRPETRVTVMENPRLRGIAQALDAAILSDKIVGDPRFGMIDLFVVLVDRDGDASRHARANEREREHGGRLHVCLAIEEVEVWMLALHRDAVSASWTDIRAEQHPKTRFAYPFLSEHAPKRSVGGGMKWAMDALDRKTWRGLLQLCPELDELRQKIATFLQASGAS